jgi:peptide-methionine (S)-S-oxide reductase
VVRTRVGYAGGSKLNPTYHSLGNHSETIQIDYDPTQITYEELLDVFWNNHSPTSRSVSRQYASIAFTHDEEQRQLAMETKERQEAERGRQIHTEIVPYTEFWRAEDYHQKYRLRGVKDLMGEFEAMYPHTHDLVDSTAAARVNGYSGGHGTMEQLEEEISRLGLSEEGRERLREIAEQRLR